MTRGLITIICLFISSNSLSQELKAALTLRLGPGIGYPVNIELPSGTDIDIHQRRHTWLLVQDERGAGGWARIAEVGASGGLEERLAWRLKELKEKHYGQLVGRLFYNELGAGLSLGWKVNNRFGVWQGEIERASDSQGQWLALAGWYLSEHEFSNLSYYRAGVGLGLALENKSSEVFSPNDENANSLYGGLEVAAGLRPIKQLDTGLSLRYLYAANSTTADSTVISWYWSFEL
jgi:hypothetical protein